MATTMVGHGDGRGGKPRIGRAPAGPAGRDGREKRFPSLCYVGQHGPFSATIFRSSVFKKGHIVDNAAVIVDNGRVISRREFRRANNKKKKWMGEGGEGGGGGGG